MNKQIKKEIIKNLLFVVLGLALGVLGYLQTGVMQKTLTYGGIAFVIIGLIQALIYYLTRNNENHLEKIAYEHEERSVFIRNKSGNISFWITFAFIGITSNLSYFNTLKVNIYGAISLIILSITYFTTLGIIGKKY